MTEQMKIADKSDWTPEDALRFYADQRHFDVVDGKTRILDTGSVASNALKHCSLNHLALKGDSELCELRAEVERLQQTRAICPTCACKIDEAIGVDVAAKNRTIQQQAERIAELERERDDLLENAECFEQEASLATDELDTKIAAQSAALAKARNALQAEVDEAFIHGVEVIPQIAEALAAIDALGQPEGEKGGAA